MLKIYNTMSRKIENFKPIQPPHVGLYTCGPTVYGYPHIGNYRAYIFTDILKRYLKWNGYDVKHVMNLTDVDDKTIRDSRVAGKNLKEFTKFYSDEFLKDLKDLNIESADIYPKATEHINEMTAIIDRLMDNGCAYKSTDGSVYFNIQKFKNYGKLAHLKYNELQSGASKRVKSDDYTKDNVQDFALWKAWDESDGEVHWDPSTTLETSPEIGRGRPGWHIECSAMSMKHLGESFDIHTGGRDLIFPHHENEIAQSECATGKPFVQYWMHNEWLLVDGKKMSKSLKNFYTLRDVEARGFSPLAFRYLALQNHYRTPLNFTWQSIEAAETGLNNLRDRYLELGKQVGDVKEDYLQKFSTAMDSDLETPRALALVWEIMKDPNISSPDKKATLLHFDKVLGLNLVEVKLLQIPDIVQKLLAEREEARQNKDFKKSDELRVKIESLGYSLKDTPTGPKISKK